MKQNHPLIQLGDDPQVEAFLSERIYEYNAEATGYFDGQSFHAVRRGQSGNIQAGIYGYTWGGCCYVSYLWVHASLQKNGLGSALLDLAESHARSQGCVVMILSSHSFQAPNFYLKKGYAKQCEIRDHPVGHANIVFIKRLERSTSKL